MLGVTKAEAYFAFSGDDVQYGIEADRRSKILKSFVRNTYSYHLSEILATIINEYTDWERPVQHPINIRWEIWVVFGFIRLLTDLYRKLIAVYIYSYVRVNINEVSLITNGVVS